MDQLQASFTSARSTRRLSNKGRGRASCRHRRAGAAVVELAILLPLLVFLFVITVDFARVYYCSLTLTNCARAGALYASDPTGNVESPFASAEAAALAEATNLSPPPRITQSTGAGGSHVAVTADYTFTTITSFPGVPNSINLSRTVYAAIAPKTPDTD